MTEQSLPAVGRLPRCCPFGIDDLLADLDVAGKSAFGGVVESLPLEALAYAQADLMKGSDLCVVGVQRDRLAGGASGSRVPSSSKYRISSGALL
jgi:hypothetical protein